MTTSYCPHPVPPDWIPGEACRIVEAPSEENPAPILGLPTPILIG